MKDVLSNSSIVKIFYSGDNDLCWLQRDFSLTVTNYFDVKAAALFLDKTIDCSLANLVETYCEKGQMDRKKKKILQISAWWQRPLTEEQLNYAALDSHYLIFLREKLLSAIFEKQKDFKMIYGFFEKMEENTKKKYQPKEFSKFEYYELFKKLFKCNKLNKQEIGVPEEEKKLENEDNKMNFDKNKMQFFFIKFAKLRDQQAREKNIGVEDLCSTNSLFELSKLSDSSIEDLFKSEKFSEQDIVFLKNNEVFIEKIFEAKAEEINDEILKLMGSNKVFSHLEKEKRKQERMKQMEDLFTRKNPAYDNCSILAPDGYLLW